MHELSIAQSIVEIVEQNLPAKPIDGVKSVRVKVGEMAGVVAESLEFCFEALIAETRLHGARLEIERIPVTAFCRACSQLFAVEQYAFQCTACGSTEIEIRSGRELQVEAVELLEHAEVL